MRSLQVNIMWRSCLTVSMFPETSSLHKHLTNNSFLRQITFHSKKYAMLSVLNRGNIYEGESLVNQQSQCLAKLFHSFHLLCNVEKLTWCPAAFRLTRELLFCTPASNAAIPSFARLVPWTSRCRKQQAGFCDKHCI